MEREELDCAPVGIDWCAPDASEYPLWVEPKADGFFVRGERGDDGKWSFRSRSGHYIELPRINPSSCMPKDAGIVEAEVMGASFSAVKAGKPGGAYLLIHDAMTDASDRRRLSERLAMRGIDPGRTCSGPQDAYQPDVQDLSMRGLLCSDSFELDAAYHRFLASGWEGAVAKRLDGLPGAPFYRRKPILTIDGRIVFVEPAKRDGVVLVVECGDVRTRVPVQGHDAKQFADGGPLAVGVWVEFQAQERLESGKYRHPRFLRRRPDKGGKQV